MNIFKVSVRQLLIVIFLIAILLAAGKWVQLRMTHVYTDDARVAADMIDISSQVYGRIVKVAVSSGDQVSKDDVLLLVDSREATLKLRQTEARVAALNAGYESLQAEIQMVELQTGGALESARSQLESSIAAQSSADSELEFRANEWQRSQALRAKNIISAHGYEEAQTLFRKSQQAREAALANVAGARAKLTEAQADRSRLIVMEKNLVKLQYERESLEAEMQRYAIDLSDRHMLAPSAGIIDNVYIDSGEYVLPGMRIMLMHNPADIWVSANVKETEVKYLKVGQTVDVSVDAYPDKQFTGTVEKIGHAATSQFALLPSTNPSGNFTKVTQRLTVKISLPQEELLLRPGMMVEVAIDIR